MTAPPTPHKDRRPEDTVTTLRELLRSCDVLTRETDWREVSGRFFSVVIRDAEWPQVLTGGKGASREYALASGYAEFLERLQNGFLYHRSYGLMPGYDAFHPDERDRPTHAAFEQRPEIFSTLCTQRSADDFAALWGPTVRCAPFFDVDEKAVTHLPVFLIQACCGTNGMCAGNNAEEAILQGICEILERYVRREIVLHRVEAPTIPLTELDGLGVGDSARCLEERGLTVVAKDCTLDGRFPVVGVVVFDRSRTRYRVKLGADPLFEVALQRAMAEAVQGFDDRSVEGWSRFRRPETEDWGEPAPATPIAELAKNAMTGVGTVPLRFVLADGKPRHSQAFRAELGSNRESLHWMVDRLRAAGYRIFARDVSVLGFPAYHVYIPGLSEHLGPADAVQLRYFASDRSRLQRTLLRLASASEEEIRECVGLIESISAHPVLASLLLNRSLINRLGLYMAESPSSFSDLDERQLCALLCMRTGDDEGAYRHLRAYAESGADHGDLELYLRCAATFQWGRASGLSPREMEVSLGSIYGRDLAGEVLADLSDPERTFQYMALPHCGSCKGCPVEDLCLYETWRARISSIQARMVPVDQRELAPVFDS